MAHLSHIFAQSNIKNKNMANKTNSAKQCKKVRTKEAKIRRKIAKRWDMIARGGSYQKACSREYCQCETSELKDELFDGILINLREKNSKKSYSRQKRILRRIVEKRQAQIVHHIVGKTESRFSNYMSRHCISMSMKQMSVNQLVSTSYVGVS